MAIVFMNSNRSLGSKFPRRCHFSPPSAHVDSTTSKPCPSCLYLTWCHTAQAWLGRGLEKCGRENACKRNDGVWRGLTLKFDCGMKSNMHCIMTFILRPVISWNHARQELRLCSVFGQNVRSMTLMHLILLLPRIFLHINIDNFELI